MQMPEFEAFEKENGIFYHYENVPYELKSTLKITSWLKQIIEQEKKSLSLLNFIFCKDEYLYKINLTYLNHDTLTDIITFPYTELPLIEGDIYISLDRIKENAEKFNVSFENELYRVIAHGVLHLCGYGDKSAEEAKLMRQKEDEALSLLLITSI